MTFNKFKEMNLLNVVLITLALIQYYLLTPLNTISEKFLTVGMSFDLIIKLIPGFIIPYYSIYILLFLVLILISKKRNSENLTVFLFALVILWSIIDFSHAFFPVNNIIRPEITGQGFFFDVVKNMYSSVKPFNTLPNWHVSTAILCAIAFRDLNFSKTWLIILWTVLICLSPLFLKMTYLIDVFLAIPLPFLCYSIASKLTKVTIKTETVQEIVKIFSLESLIQSIAIGMRDEGTISALIDNLTRIEKSLTERDKEDIKSIGSEMDPPKETLKEIINDLILSINVQKQIQRANELFGKNNKSYVPSENDIKEVTDELINNACKPFDISKFRYCILQIKKRNTERINNNSIESASKERSSDIIFKFKSFIESHKEDIPALKIICENNNGHIHISNQEILNLVNELRKPPYEISTEEIWNAYYRVDSKTVKPLSDEGNPSNIISLTQFAIGKLNILEPYTDNVDKKFEEWLKSNDKKYSEEELVWLRMMKNYISSNMEINMLSFNQAPFLNKGGASKAYKIFGPDLNRIIYELNENLI